MPVRPLEFDRLRVQPLAARATLVRADDILISPVAPPAPVNEAVAAAVDHCAAKMRDAKQRGAGVLLFYGAHLLRNGAARLLERLMAGGWLTHLATNGAGSIHDWEFAWLGASTESVAQGIPDGTFGAWHETAHFLHLALLTGALDGLGYGASLGRFIAEDGSTLPGVEELVQAIADDPANKLTAARADFLHLRHHFPTCRVPVPHRWKYASILAQGWVHKVPATVHPGIGYDIIANHPIFSGAVLGRAGELDFKLLGGSMETLDGGVVLSIGSAVMAPQVFEKSLSCVNNLRRQQGRGPVCDHSIFVVDLQDGGGWDWTRSEPPKDHPAYYLRFCKSFSRTGGTLQYVQADNAAFVHHLHHALTRP